MLAFYRPFTARTDGAALVPAVQSGGEKGAGRCGQRVGKRGKKEEEGKEREKEGTSLVKLTAG